MSQLLNRLRDSLPPRYAVRREIARGGMGAVFLAHDEAIDRDVAIKVLLPEHATERLARLFVREARILGRLSSHPNVVAIHDAGEAAGLYYYVMEYVAGDTLAARLANGPLSTTATRSLGCDLLGVLEAVHALGVVHRDIKPGNVFLARSRALLADFGIAKSTPATGETGTRTGDVVGTPSYMPPEQLRGEVTARTDLYALGMVLFEAVSGRPWSPVTDVRRADWSGVPRSLAKVLMRALAHQPKDRWPDALSFRRALAQVRPRPWPGYWRAAGLAVLGMGGGLILATVLSTSSKAVVPTGALSVKVEPFEVHGSAPAWVADSIRAYVTRTLEWVSTFRVVENDVETAAIHLRGTVTAASSGTRVELWTAAESGASVRALGTGAEWQAAADSAARLVVMDLWSERSPFARWLPRAAMPRDNPRGFDAWIEAERAHSEGRWGDAFQYLHLAVAIDSTCLICSWLITEVQRWRIEPPDSFHRQRTLDNLDAFPPHWIPFIKARLGRTNRMDSLRAATEQWGDFYYTWFLLGEEAFNRGPLYGDTRAQAIPHLERAALLRPNFAPIWWSLVWVYTAEGDTANATRALQATPPHRDTFSFLLRTLLDIGFAFRFAPPDDARAVAAALLRNPDLIGDPHVGAGPRLLPAFDSPDGAIALGAMFASITARPDLQRSGLLAQMFGYIATGRVRDATARAQAYVRRIAGNAEFGLFLAELDGTRMVVGDSAVPVDVDDVNQRLRRLLPPGAASSAQRVRAQWMLTLVRGASGRTPRPSDHTGHEALDAVAAAQALANAGRPIEALRRTEALAEWQVADQAPDPFFRTVLHLLRARWHTQSDNPQAAIRELRWHEAVDQYDLPTGDPLIQEVDWSFGTLARWRRAQLLDAVGGDHGDLCRAYEGVARLWREGQEWYRRRADSARQRHATLQCDPPGG